MKKYFRNGLIWLIRDISRFSLAWRIVIKSRMAKSDIFDCCSKKLHFKWQYVGLTLEFSLRTFLSKFVEFFFETIIFLDYPILRKVTINLVQKFGLHACGLHAQSNSS